MQLEISLCEKSVDKFNALGLKAKKRKGTFGVELSKISQKSNLHRANEV